MQLATNSQSFESGISTELAKAKIRPVRDSPSLKTLLRLCTPCRIPPMINLGIHLMEIVMAYLEETIHSQL